MFLVTVVAQLTTFTIKTTKNAIYFLSLMSYSINKLKSFQIILSGWCTPHSSAPAVSTALIFRYTYIHTHKHTHTHTHRYIHKYIFSQRQQWFSGLLHFVQWMVCVLALQNSFKTSLVFLFPPLKKNRPLNKSTTEQQIRNKLSHLIVRTNYTQPIAQFIIDQWRYLWREQPIHQPKKGSHFLRIKKNFEGLMIKKILQRDR